MLKFIAPLAAQLALLAVGGIAAQTPAPPAAPQAQAAPADPTAEAPRISVAEARKALDAGKAILVDVRSPMSYDQEHAKGSISLPLYDLPSRAGELPKDKQIITYCT